MAGKGFRYTIGSRAVAVAIMTEVLRHAEHVADVKYGKADTSQVAEELVRLAWDVEYKPTAERLVLTIDAGISTERQPAEPEPAVEL